MCLKLGQNQTDALESAMLLLFFVVVVAVNFAYIWESWTNHF